MPPSTSTTSETSSFAPLSNPSTLATLTTGQKTALIIQIAEEMTSSMITISKELRSGNLTSENTEPICAFIRIIQQHEVATRCKLEEKLERMERRERKWRVERERVRREFVGLRRRVEGLRRGWDLRRFQALGLDSGSGSGPGYGYGYGYPYGIRYGVGYQTDVLGTSRRVNWIRRLGQRNESEGNTLAESEDNSGSSENNSEVANQRDGSG
ncbi:hypothetical protein BJX70DRAFT_105132 [Aspergillus crustosus]